MSSESDEPASSHALHNLLADLNLPQQSAPRLPTWSFPSAPVSRAGSADNTGSTSIFPSQPTSRNTGRPTSELDLAVSLSSPATHPPSLFSTPNRSIFSSGPPIASVSANTAHASMSAPPPGNSFNPLSALPGPSPGTSRRVHYQTDNTGSVRSNRMAQVEKDVDDPSTPTERTSMSVPKGTTTPTALTRLFTAPDSGSPTVSRHTSYIRTHSGTTYTRASMETAPLPSHLYTRGLLNGRHSDITVHAFGTKYALHRLILDRAPFFSSALSEPWFESTSKDITLQPDDVDSNITQAAFELALKKLYGCDISAEEDGEAIGLFATGCWLEMTDLIDTSVNSILRQMKPSKLGSFIRLVTSNYYGKPGDRILASAKSMLCREGWEMSIRHWDDISGDIIREIIGGDGFFVQGEWERFVLAKRLLDRRLRFKALESGLYDSTGKIKRPPPSTTAFDAIRFDTVYRKSMPVVTPQVPEAFDPWLALYTSPDVSALLVLLDEGIHYVHLSFEQLKKIREQRDALGLPLMPERVISNALWMSMELRQKVVNANELDLELGLTEEANEHDEDHPISPTPNRKLTAENEGTSKGKGKQIEVPVEQEEEEMESGSWDGNALPRKFWIPTTDSTSVMGGTPESIMAAAHASHPSIPRHISRLSASLDPQDVQWATDFTAAGERPQTPGHVKVPTITPPLCYSWYPPFRFAAEFPNPRSLKEKKRVYSRTVWYAGSLWNVYIQKVETTKNTQLGVYLHRAKDKEHDGLRHGAVDERIGQVELLMRRNQRHQREHQQQHQQGDADDETGTSSGDPDATLIHHSADATRANAISSLLRGDPIHKSSQNPLPLSSMPDRTYNSSILSDSDDPSSLLDYSSTTAAPSTSPNSKEKMAPRRKPALPAYVDGRPTIKTYFKIYSPSKGGRMLSVYESAPDRFNFSQSWGWKSSTMILDDGMLGYEAAGEPKKTGNLRFMVVIGNV